MPLEIILAIIIIPIIILGTLSVIFINKKVKVKSINIDWLLTIFGDNNLQKVERTNKRISITFKDLKKVDLESLKKATKGIFIKGETVVVTFLNDQEEIYESLQRLV